MIAGSWSALTAAGCFAGALTLVGPRIDDGREFGSWLARPAVLPFAWGALRAASRVGNSDEVFARAQQLLNLLPTWTDGHAVFASQFVLDGDDLQRSESERVAAAYRRLQIALAWLENARASAGRREIELLQQMAFLPDIAVAREPGLAAVLPPGGTAAIADHYLAIAEHLGAGPVVRENRTFLAVPYCRGLLDAGDRRGALAVLDAAIARSVDVRDRELATVWSARLDEVRRYLRGEPIDLTLVQNDPRMAILLPYLR
jgi:hypothetical protein